MVKSINYFTSKRGIKCLKGNYIIGKMKNELYYGKIFMEFFYDEQSIFDKLPVLHIYNDSSATDYIDYIGHISYLTCIAC